MGASVVVGSSSSSAAADAYNSTLLVFGMLNITLCSVASFLSLVLIAATTIPLMYPKMRKRYSTYNLYLAYLSVPDLVVNIFILSLTIINTRWTTDDGIRYNSLWFYDLRWDDAVFPMCTSGNLYTNAFLTYEIYKLLKNSSLRKRYYPPTLWEVTKHAMMSYGLGITVLLFDYFVVADRLYGDNGDSTAWASPATLSALRFLYWAASLTICILIPLMVWMGVSGMIFWKGLIGSTRSLYEGRLRVLTLFFLRIAFIDVLIWLPCLIRYTMRYISEDEKTQVIAYHVALLFSGIQVIANFGCALTKLDTRMLIADLLTLVYCRKRGKDDDGGDGDEPDHDDREQTDELGRRRDPYLRTSLAIFRPRRRVSESNTVISQSFSQQSQAFPFSQRFTTTTTSSPPSESLSVVVAAKEEQHPDGGEEFQAAAAHDGETKKNRAVAVVSGDTTSDDEVSVHSDHSVHSLGIPDGSPQIREDV